MRPIQQSREQGAGGRWAIWTVAGPIYLVLALAMAFALAVGVAIVAYLMIAGTGFEN